MLPCPVVWPAAANMLRLGMVGSATVISDDAGPIGILASILLWVTAYVLYL